MLDIFLIVAGIGFVAISYLITDKFGKKGHSLQDAAQVDVWTEKDEQRVKERIEVLLLEKTEEAMIKTDDQLSQISNEKIMAVSEFSDQILEKIKQNHTEIIFLFDMLNEKDNEIKKLVQELTMIKTKTETSMKNVTEELDYLEKVRTGVDTDKKPITEMEILKKASKEEMNLETPKKKTINPPKKKDEPVKDVKPTSEIGNNKNKQILTLYEEGNTIIEIAKVLSLGQGEVKLVIDLFQRARG